MPVMMCSGCVIITQSRLCSRQAGKLQQSWFLMTIFIQPSIDVEPFLRCFKALSCFVINKDILYGRHKFDSNLLRFNDQELHLVRDVQQVSVLVSDTSLSLSLSLAPGLWCQNSGSECQSQLRPGLAWPVRPRLWLWQLARVFRYVNTYRGETSDNISTTSLQKTDSGPQPKKL